MKDNYIEVEDFLLIHSTEKAYYIRDLNGKDYWIPKSQIQYIDFGDDIELRGGQVAKQIRSMEIPEWLAEEKDLI